MKPLSSLVDAVLKKTTGKDLPKLQEDLSTNLEFRLLFPIDFSKPFKEAKKEFLSHYMHDLLTLSLGNVSLAAKKAQLHRRHLHRVLNDLEINPEEHRKEMLKPSHYLKENVYEIMEQTLESYQKNEDIEHVYSQLDDISEILAESMNVYSYEEALALFEKAFIEHVLKHHQFDIASASEELDMSERTLYRKINKLQIAVT